MNVFDLLQDKYILFRNTIYTDIYWCESACGYTDYIEAAGVYSAEDLKYYGLKVLQYHEVKSGKHTKYTHYAMTVKDAIQLLK